MQNVIEETSHPNDGSLKVVKFAKSPSMSTYLVAFVVGEFDFVDGKDVDGVPIRVYTPMKKAVQGQFALEVVVVVVVFFILSYFPSFLYTYFSPFRPVTTCADSRPIYRS